MLEQAPTTASTISVIAEFTTRWIVWAALDLVLVVVVLSVFHPRPLVPSMWLAVIAGAVAAIALIIWLTRRRATGFLRLGFRYRVWIVASIATAAIWNPSWWIPWASLTLPQAADCIAGALAMIANHSEKSA